LGSLKNEEPSPHHLLYQLQESASFCVKAYSGEKIFLNQENILFTKQGALLRLNEANLIALPLLQINRMGFFLETDWNVAAAKKRKTKGQCPACFEDTDSKGVCRNSKCDFCGIKVL
jgi:hypothetical protein